MIVAEGLLQVGVDCVVEFDEVEGEFAVETSSGEIDAAEGSLDATRVARPQHRVEGDKLLPELTFCRQQYSFSDGLQQRLCQVCIEANVVANRHVRGQYLAPVIGQVVAQCGRRLDLHPVDCQSWPVDNLLKGKVNVVLNENHLSDEVATWQDRAQEHGRDASLLLQRPDQFCQREAGGDRIVRPPGLDIAVLRPRHRHAGDTDQGDDGNHHDDDHPGRLHSLAVGLFLQECVIFIPLQLRDRRAYAEHPRPAMFRSRHICAKSTNKKWPAPKRLAMFKYVESRPASTTTTT